MEHVVFFPAQDGSPAFRRVPSLDEAVRLVEHLRNVEGVAEVSCHALTEVPLAFRAYYRVEVPAAQEPAVQAAPEPMPVQAADLLGTVPVASMQQEVEQEVEPEVQQEPEPALASANGRSGDGAKSLGFFA